MKISFVVCGNGYGHLKRVIQVIDRILIVNKEVSIQIITGSSHGFIVNQWLEQNSEKKNFVTFVNGFTEYNLGNNLERDYTFEVYKRSLDTIEKLLRQFGPEKVVSDNLVGIASYFSGVILMGSFLWADVLHENKNSEVLDEICEYENALLSRHQLLMIGVHDMAMDYVKKKTEFVGVPWFCERVIIPSFQNQKINILVTGGGTPSLINELLEIADELRINSKVTVSLDAKLYEASVNKEFFKPFSFSDQHFSSLDWIICRPGIGSLTDAVKYTIPVCVLTEENKEIAHNAEKVESLGIGIIHRTTSLTEKVIMENEARVFQTALRSLQTGGAALAAEIILHQ